jgi:hypothetical protein
MSGISWEALLRDARGYLGLDEGEPVPREELVEQGRANGWQERELTLGLRETDDVEAIGDAENMLVLETGNNDGSGPERPENNESSPAEPDSDGVTPGGEGGDTTKDRPNNGDTWHNAIFTTPNAKEWPQELLDIESWMGHKDKLPFAPWGDKNADLECTKPCAASTTAKCECDARWKWGHTGNYVDGHTIAIAEEDHRLDGRVFLQQDDDRYAFVDGDDVRCPETGEVHPDFVEILERLGITYGDVSTSGSGVHANYKGQLPDGVKQAVFQIDDEPWGDNDEDDLPTIEIYDGKHVCVATGEHVPGTPLEVYPWDDDELRSVLDEYDQLPEVNPTEQREDFDKDDYEPDATESHETTEDRRDIYTALDNLNAQHVADKTIVDSWIDSSSADNRAFVPTWAEADYDGTANFVGENAWTDSGTRAGYGGPAVMAAIASSDISFSDKDAKNGAVKGADWYRAVEYLRELGFTIPKFVGGKGKTGDSDDPRDALEVEVTPDADVAWRAAGAVVPTDLERPIPLETDVNNGQTGWKCPSTNHVVDVVRAVAICEDIATDADTTLDATDYHRAYKRAKEAYGAPLPRFLTAEDATARHETAHAAAWAAGFFHLDRDAVRSEITGEGDEVSGDTSLTLDPVWRASKGGESVLVFDSGTIWDADTEETISVVKFAALEAEDIPVVDPRQSLKNAGDGVYSAAYERARAEYGAPLPRWNPGTPDGHTPLLPPADDMEEVENPTRDDELWAARDEVEDLYRELATEEEPETPSVLKVLPSLGKTTSAVKCAAEQPTTYLAPRKELQLQAYEKAEEFGLSAAYLPVLGGNIRGDILAAAVEDVRESEDGKNRLRDRWSILAEVEDGQSVFDDEDDDDEETVDLDRPTCGCATGEHGEDWALAVHVARKLDFTPRDIHTRDKALFGTTLPCKEGEDEDDEEAKCEYTEGWDRVSDYENPPDLLIGHYVHAYVESARTLYTKDMGDRVKRSPRTVVLDEYPGVGIFGDDFGDEAFQHVRWIATALRDDVDDLRDVYENDLWNDEYIRRWLDGEGDDVDVMKDISRALQARENLLIARQGAVRFLDHFEHETLEAEGFLSPMKAITQTADEEELIESKNALNSQIKDGPDHINSANHILPRKLHQSVRLDVWEPLRNAIGDKWDTPSIFESEEIHEWLRNQSPEAAELSDCEGGAGLSKDPTKFDGLPIGEELRNLVTTAVQAFQDDDDSAYSLINAAKEAIQGGDEGVRSLAVWSDNGYAHRSAHHLLRGVITPTSGDDARGARLQTTGFAYLDGENEGTTLDHIQHDDATILVDRNGKGATVYEPPSRLSGSGDRSPFIGLDATARAPLWSLTLGEQVSTHDIHDTPRHRQQFMRDVLGLQVIVVGNKARAYEGDPKGKDLNGDAALLRELKERYSGVRAARDRNGTPTQIGRPACITTKGVKNVLQERDDLEDVVDTWDNYGNVTGDNELGEHTLAAILGTQHYGDHAVEYLAALGGEEIRRTGYGMALDYGSQLANSYLKHMREDQLLQAVLRFTRGGTGALVVCRTAAIHEDLPIAGEGHVATTWSETATQLARTWRRAEGDTFTVSDLDGVDASTRHVRRTLAQLADAGYLERLSESAGVATEYEPTGPTPERAEFDLEDLDAPGQQPHTVSYTANVRVRAGDRLLDRTPRSIGSVLPAPAAEAEGDPPS